VTSEKQVEPYPKVYRVTNGNGYGVKAFLNGLQFGESTRHTDHTRNHPELVERRLDTMETLLRQQCNTVFSVNA